jgi:hypothetical protein
MATKYTKLPQNTPNACKIFGMDTKYAKLGYSKELQNKPKIAIFWFENTLLSYGFVLNTYQCDQIGRIFAFWEVIFFGKMFSKFVQK